MHFYLSNYLFFMQINNRNELMEYLGINMEYLWNKK